MAVVAVCANWTLPGCIHSAVNGHRAATPGFVAPGIAPSLASPQRLNHLDHLHIMAALGSNSTWGIVGLRKGKIRARGGYP